VLESNLMMIGDGMDATIISGDLSSGRDKLDTYFTFTVSVDGPGFIARDITFRNTAVYVRTKDSNSTRTAKSVVRWTSSLAMQLPCSRTAIYW
ncbi:pectinesterase/pectinesterase inhibitor PPE8B, partial [Trifolium medium]|nr:pectinesterase/pectinesterase inhibitor PPE8B [Trifolium medium]